MAKLVDRFLGSKTAVRIVASAMIFALAVIVELSLYDSAQVKTNAIILMAVVFALALIVRQHFLAQAGVGVLVLLLAYVGSQNISFVALCGLVWYGELVVEFASSYRPPAKTVEAPAATADNSETAQLAASLKTEIARLETELAEAKKAQAVPDSKEAEYTAKVFTELLGEDLAREFLAYVGRQTANLEKGQSVRIFQNLDRELPHIKGALKRAFKEDLAKAADKKAAETTPTAPEPPVTPPAMPPEEKPQVEHRLPVWQRYVTPTNGDKGGHG